MSMWEGKQVAVLLRRGKFHHKKLCGQKYPGGCQITTHSDLLESETPEQGTKRGLADEIGQDAAEIIIDNRQNLNTGKMSWSVDEETPTAFVTSFIVYVPNASFITPAKLNGSAGGFEMLTEDRVGDIKNLRDFSNVTGVTDLNTVAMFPDEASLVKKGFELIRGLPQP